MFIRNGYEKTYERDISTEEYEVINKFLDFYKKQDIIVADYYQQQYRLVPIVDDRVIFKSDKDYKEWAFSKRIFHNGKHYQVVLGLCGGQKEDNSRCLNTLGFRVVSNEKVHSIAFDTADDKQRNTLFNIINIFDDKKIISPEHAYYNRLYTGKELINFIKNHEWGQINTGIQQMPELANALFMISEEFEAGDCDDISYNSNYTAYFGTILYQLISFRMNNMNAFDEKDLRQLDELIFKLRKTQLLKVGFFETILSRACSKKSILLDYNNFKVRNHASKQYTVNNMELLEKQKTLSKCIKNLTCKHE